MALVGDHYYRQVKRLDSGSRFLTFSCYRRLPLFRNDGIKKEFVNHLLSLRDRGLCDLQAWVVMPEHVHLLLTPSEGVTGRHIVSVLKAPFARRVIARWLELKAPILERIRDGLSYRYWQPGGGYDRNIWTYEEFAEKCKYIELNPVRRGLCARAADWTWSSYRQRFDEVSQTARPEDGTVAPGGETSS